MTKEIQAMTVDAIKLANSAKSGTASTANEKLADAIIQLALAVQKLGAEANKKEK